MIADALSGSAAGDVMKLRRLAARDVSDVGLGRKDLTAAVLARLQINVVRTAALTRFLVFYVCRCRQRVVRTAHTALHARGFSLWDSHTSLQKV